MTTHQVVSVFLDLALIILLARTFGALARRWGQPAVIGEVLAGILAGPTLLGEDLSLFLFPMEARPFLTALANIGIAVFMLLVGLEMDENLLRGRGRIAVSVAVTAIVLPLSLGVCLGFFLARNHASGNTLGFVLFIGAAMSVTAFPVLARILTDRGLARTSLGNIALTCAAIDDVLAWSLLAVVAVVASATASSLWLLLLFPVYVAVMAGVVRPVLRRVFPPGSQLDTRRLGMLLGGALVSGAITEWLGMHFIFGVFIFGVMVPRAGTGALRQAMRERAGEFNGVFLMPIFFVVAGLKVQLSGIGWMGVAELGLVLLVAVGGKFGGAFLAARLNRMQTRQSLALATLMNTRGLTELIILTAGLQLGILDSSLYSIMVVMAVITTVMAGPLLTLIRPMQGMPDEEGDRAGEDRRAAAAPGGAA
ncbi:cation:proton antiporter domain-containing protein [Sphaerisporangium aureirubrum]|uniref:Cation:proton antiporter n=1 Tax=Sphaerisporangium aureirubrum TaxID=1544736 RepID=A0ABW1NPM8_9ACTN